MKQVRKALVAGFAGATTAIVTAAQDGAITGAEWLTVAVAAAAAGYAVYKVRNAPAVPPAE